jgi:hypothetical protein
MAKSLHSLIKFGKNPNLYKRLINPGFLLLHEQVQKGSDAAKRR